MINKIALFVGKYYLYIIFFISLLGTLGSLAIGYVLNLTPCDLCWYQRVFMYSIFVVSLTGVLIKDEKDTYKYIIGLVVPGMIISLYNYYIQLFPNNLIIECSLNNPCSKVDFILFGFLTIPLMAFVAFMLIFILCLIKFKKRRYI